MYLCQWLADPQCPRYPQVGLILGATCMTERLQQFGYAEATFLQDTLSVCRHHCARTVEFIAAETSLAAGRHLKCYPLPRNMGIL
jgi:cobyrinic acid a,c-diamide synthase